MQKIFVSSTGAKAGQSLVAWSIAEVFRSSGMRTGFFKPFATRPQAKNGRIVDRDALLMKEYFDLKEELELICPVVSGEVPLDEVTGEEQLEKIERSYEVVRKEKDALIMMGSKQVFYEADSPFLPDGNLINKFDAPVVLIDKFQSESMSMYSVLAVESFLKEKVKLVIINQIPPDRMDAAYRKLFLFFQKRGSPRVFLVPEDRILAAFTIRNIVDIVQGNVLMGQNCLDNVVESTSISSSHLQGSLHLFRRVYNKIILLGPKANDAPTQALPPVITGILLTGGRKPPSVLVNMCDDLGIPLILSPHDTFTSMEKIQKHQPHVTHEDVFKLKRFLQLLGGQEEIRKILEAIA